MLAQLSPRTRMRLTAVVVATTTVVASGYFMQRDRDTAPVASVSAMIVAPSFAPARSDAVAAKLDQGPAMPKAPAEEIVARAAVLPVLAAPATPDFPAAPRGDGLTLAATGGEAQVMTPGPVDPVASIDAPSVAGCQQAMTAMAAPGAMVELTLESPCDAGARVTIAHAGLRFSTRLDQAGLVQVAVPALTEEAQFIAAFGDGRTQSADILMPTARDYQRAALSWQGDAGFELYALENGAAYGSPGHVSAATPYSPSRAAAGEGGFHTQLGDLPEGYHAAVYSYPSRLTDTGAQPEIDIEAIVSEANCAGRIDAVLLRREPGGALATDTLTMAVPGCDALGEYLVLKNPAQQRRIARN